MPTKVPPSILFPDPKGDLTLTWHTEEKEEILKLIQQLLSSGYTFFLLKPRFLGLRRAAKPSGSLHEVRRSGATKELISSCQALEIAETRGVDIFEFDDPIVSEAVQTGLVLLSRGRRTDQTESYGRSASAHEIARSTSLAVRPIRRR